MRNTPLLLRAYPFFDPDLADTCNRRIQGPSHTKVIIASVDFEKDLDRFSISGREGKGDKYVSVSSMASIVAFVFRRN